MPNIQKHEKSGSSRHVSMDAVSVLQESWESNCLHLSLQCIPETEEVYTIALPESYTGPKIQCTGAEARITQDGNILTLFVKGKEEQAEIKISICEKPTKTAIGLA